MAVENYPYATPNKGLVQDPAKRRVIVWVLGIVGIILGSVVAADLAAPEIDVAFVTAPATAVYLYLNATFGLGGTLPNIPKL